MRHAPYRLFSAVPEEDLDERPAIFGLETEYVVLFVPDDMESGERPPFSAIQEVLFGVLLAERKAAQSSGSKRGYFLQNGGLVHLEIYLRHQDDTPILEACTPECRSPWDAMVFSRSFDYLLSEVSRKSVDPLAKKGYHGYIAFGKNNRDERGVGFGCHENYLIHESPGRWRQAAFIVALLISFLFLAPALLLYLLIITLVLLCLGVFRIFPPLETRALALIESLKKRPKFWRNLVASSHLGSNCILYPGILVYTLFLRALAFPHILKYLASFLVTRQVFAGSGGLDFVHSCYEVSQRADRVKTLSNIVIFGKGKTIFDLKTLLFRPRAFFARMKRLSITGGDSNLSDIPCLLKLGTTALIIEMIEAGERFDDLRLRRPVHAMKQAAREGPWKELDLRGGGRMSAIAIQRAYLLRAREFFRGRKPGTLRSAEILYLWERVLDGLEEGPETLGDTLDWVSKRQIMDVAIREQTTWNTFFLWGKAFHLAGIEATRAAKSVDDLAQLAPLRRRWALRRVLDSKNVNFDEYDSYRDLYFKVRKIDFRYHELNPLGGYQRSLEREGLIQRLTTDEDVEIASREPPRYTRARIRGYYIRISSHPESIFASWSEVEQINPFRHIKLNDPFFYRLPEDKD